jgi:hypothetical protein
LSGCPSVTDSDVKYVRSAVIQLSPWLPIVSSSVFVRLPFGRAV